MELACRVTAPASPAAGAVPIVLLHGLFGAASNFTTVSRQLAVGRRVLAFDLRNHGDSPHAPTMSYAEMAADVARGIAAHAAAPALVVGHSMGGKVAMRLALDHPELVAGLVVVDIAPVAYPPAFRGYAAAMQALALTPGLTRQAADQALAASVPEAGVRSFLLLNLRWQGAQPGWRIGLDAIALELPRIEGWEGSGQFGGSVLSVAGGRSAYVPAQHRPAFRNQFPRARFVVLEAAGHWVHADDPAGFVALVVAEAGVNDRTVATTA